MNRKNLSILTIICCLSVALAGLSVGNVQAHVYISIFAVSLLTMASLQALLLGLQNFLLKHHRPSALLRRLPPLQTMEGVLFIIISGGLLFLSGSLVSGFVFQHALFNTGILPKVILAILAWTLLTLLLAGRYFFGWRGPTAIRWTLSGTLLVILSYFGTKAFIG